MGRDRERRVSFEVGPSWVMPDLSALGYAFETATEELDTTYVDTADGLLRRLGVSLRRRTGGADTGWHLDVPAAGARVEIRSRARSETVPDSLVRRLSGVLAGSELGQVAVVSTTRRHSRLVNDAGTVVEIADDSVSGATLGATSRLDRWRLVEVGRGPAGTEEDRDEVVRLLEQAGASRSTTRFTVDRLLGEQVLRTDLDEVAQVVSAYVTEQCAAILTGEIVLRDQPSADVVHQTRVAIRRLRSTLRTLADPFVPTGTDDEVPGERGAAGEQQAPGEQRAPGAGPALDADLRWFAGLLGEIRDADVVGPRVLADLARLPAEDVLGPVAREIEETSAGDRRAAIRRWRAAWNDPRYARTLAALAAWHADPPIASDVRVNAKKVLKRARRRVERRLAEANGDPEALHGARKAAKRLRYTGDLFTDLVPKAAATAQRAKEIQTRLGHHQDLVVASAFLRRLGARHGSSHGHNGFTYGVLLARAELEAGQVSAADSPGR